jgi:cytochrome c-type biogenesis protein CcmH/NrfF
MRTAALALLVLALAAPAAAAARQPSLAEIEREVMCPSCGEPLAVSNSSQGDREVALIRRMLDRGATKRQIEDELVRQFGPGVLALPPRHGFAWTVYVAPIALFAAIATGLAAAVGRWRRRPIASAPLPPPLSDEDLERLRADLASYER